MQHRKHVKSKESALCYATIILFVGTEHFYGSNFAVRQGEII